MTSTTNPVLRHLSFDRRSLLKALAATPILGACAEGATSGGDSASGSTTTSSAGGPDTTLEYPVPDPSSPWWLQGNYGPVTNEMDIVDLDVTGSIPSALKGLYVRNGSNPKSGTSTHWFLGDGMLHGVALADGAASWYRNKYVRTGQYDGSAVSGPPSGANTASNVSVIYHGDKLLSLGEVGHPYEISTKDLSTVGVTDYGGKLKTNMTAHPKIDPKTGRMHFFGYDFVAPFLTYMVASPEGVLDHVVPIEIGESHMMHDFAITDQHAIFWVLPVVFSMDALATGMPYAWDASLPAKVGVLPLEGTADQMKWYDVDPCMVFHSSNAFEADGKIEVDVCWLSAAFDGKDLSQTSKNELRRWTIDTASGKLTETVRSKTLQDFPQIDRRYTGREHRHTWLSRVVDVGDIGIEFGGLTHRDESTEEETVWDGKGRYGPGEAFFVPESADSGEGEGFLLTFGFDRTTDNSDLLIFEALDIAKGPIAQVHMPRRVPYGFHGVFVPA